MNSPMPEIDNPTLPTDFTMEEANDLFHEIMRSYDLADDILKHIEKPDIKDRETKLEIASPLIKKTTTVTNILATLFIEMIRKGRQLNKELKDTYNATFALFFAAFRTAMDEMDDKLVPQYKNGGFTEDLSQRAVPPLTKKYLTRPMRGTDGIKILKITADTREKDARLFVLAIEDLWAHVAQLLLEFEKIDAANFKRGYPPRGFASKIANRAAAQANFENE